MNFTLSKSNLNFKVYRVPSRPTAPGAENDIAIISSVPMSNWIMSPEKPSGIPRTDGDVWIQYSTSGDTRNILKQNALMIATISAWQYVDGSWVDREAVSCQGGVWVDLVTYLFNNGNQCVDITGGWTSDGYSYGSYTTVPATIGDTMIVSATLTGGSNRACVVGTVNKVDLTNIDILRICVDSFNVNGEVYISASKNVYNDRIASADIAETGIVDIKVHELNGSYYIAVVASSSSSFTNRSMEVSKVGVK